MAIVPKVENTTFETDQEALQAEYNTAVGTHTIDGVKDTIEEMAQELGTTVEALESARVAREQEAGKRAADLIFEAHDNGLLADDQDPDTWRTRKAND